MPGRKVAPSVSAISRRDLQVVIVVDVALRTGHIRVPIGQRKPRRAVIKRCSQPAVELMTALAIAGRECRSRGYVRWIRCILPIFQMAGVAGSGKPQEHARGALLVTLFARHCRVRTQQREPILMVANRLNSDVPTLHCVALLAVWPHLPPVYVRVAIGAVFTHIRKHRLHVALHAFHFFMHSAQRIAGLVMVKFRNRTDRAPARRCMAVFARNVQRRSVWIAGSLTLARECRGRYSTRGITPGSIRERQ